MNLRCPGCKAFLPKPTVEHDDVLRRTVHIYVCKRCQRRLLKAGVA
jgi:hypothetical protein